MIYSILIILFVLSFELKDVFTLLWNIFHTFQLILALGLLYGLKMPVNLLTLRESLSDIINFQFIPSAILYDTFIAGIF